MVLLKRKEQWQATAHARETAQWRVAESPRDTPCDHWVPRPTPRNPQAGDWVPCQTPIRVKIKEPGMYWRLCDKCQEMIYYSLTPMVGHELTVLVFRWVTGDDYLYWCAKEMEGCGDLVL